MISGNIVNATELGQKDFHFAQGESSITLTSFPKWIPFSEHVALTADHGGFKFITYVLTILWHI
jgi:hypothetical protein